MLNLQFNPEHYENMYVVLLVTVLLNSPPKPPTQLSILQTHTLWDYTYFGKVKISFHLRLEQCTVPINHSLNWSIYRVSLRDLQCKTCSYHAVLCTITNNISRWSILHRTKFPYGKYFPCLVLCRCFSTQIPVFQLKCHLTKTEIQVSVEAFPPTCRSMSVWPHRSLKIRVCWPRASVQWS